ncbi:hypothetical protein K2173_017828 [Erythroxylum novogranatense]|uniref:Uncharacterized protein n=1 Tax=Erythroxylum novogranatense TaxID=1862640 RepID=A0AAV8SMJ8_9ROSI|nr:hypothetical protein K2173_017828 [Erythroxylum novogranatense]
MAGMLPGVEVARRRRLTPDSAANEWTRRSLYTSNRGTYRASINSLQRSELKQTLDAEGERLGEKAREAKGRLDVKLKSLSRSSSIRKQQDSLSLNRLSGKSSTKLRMISNLVCYRF